MLNQIHTLTVQVDILEQALREIAESPDLRGKDLFMVEVARAALVASDEVKARATTLSNKLLVEKLVVLNNDEVERREQS